MEKRDSENSSRRKFVKVLFSGGIASAAGAGLTSLASCSKDDSSGEKVKLLSADGKIVEVDKSAVCESCNHPVSNMEAREGIPNSKFVMVVDLSRCKNARQCVAACDKHHHLTPDHPFIKVLKMQDNEKSAPYWMPKTCFHCDNPPCVKVCPVGATFKRSDGIVLVDNERCIGCRFCMAACPYSARVFNWSKPKLPENYDLHYSPETSVPGLKGTVSKCDFCPDMLRNKKLPHCATACPNGTIYFGNEEDDTVTNGEETVRLSTLLRKKAGYRYLEELGTKPNVYYLPPVNRKFPFKDKEEEQA